MKTTTATLGAVSGLAGCGAGKGASTQWDAATEVNEWTKSLHLTGFRIDVVDRVVPSSYDKPLRPASPPKPTLFDNFEWVEACLRLSKSVLQTPDDISGALWRTLIANKDCKNKKYCKDGGKYHKCMRMVLARGSRKREFEDRHLSHAVDLDSLSPTGEFGLADYMGEVCVQKATIFPNRRRAYRP